MDKYAARVGMEWSQITGNHTRNISPKLSSGNLVGLPQGVNNFLSTASTSTDNIKTKTEAGNERFLETVLTTPQRSWNQRKILNVVQDNLQNFQYLNSCGEGYNHS